MKIKVQRPDGVIETLTLIPPVELRLSDTLNRLVCADGMEHFFNSDGTYGGWGRAFDGTEDEAYEAIQTVEQDREIEPPPDSGAEGEEDGDARKV